MANSNSFLGPYEILPIVQEYKHLGKFSYFIMKLYVVYSLESPHWGDSNEYTQHKIIMQKIEKTALNDRCLRPDLVPLLTLSGSNYSYPEQIFMVPRCSSHWSSTVDIDVPLVHHCIVVSHLVLEVVSLNCIFSEIQQCSRLTNLKCKSFCLMSHTQLYVLSHTRE